LFVVQRVGAMAGAAGGSYDRVEAGTRHGSILARGGHTRRSTSLSFDAPEQGSYGSILRCLQRERVMRGSVTTTTSDVTYGVCTRTSRRSVKRAVPVLLAVSTLLTVSPPPAQAALISTSVTIAATRKGFEGKVRAVRSECTDNRGVAVYRVRRGPNKLIGRVRADHRTWSLRVPFRAGKYYARVHRKPIPSSPDVCRPGKTKIITWARSARSVRVRTG
jgi:hypothetical protein